ncbi:MAG: SRPBCC domain-containing protein [Bacteroidales bacterium]|jgi:uncharacterized protein YndB with AHSA1/START domain
MGKEIINVRTEIRLPVSEVWKLWTTPQDIIRWNQASEDWHTPGAVNDLREGGQFIYRMEARDGSAGFDFVGTYEKVIPDKKIVYLIGDGRKVEVSFKETDNKTEISESFEAESINPVEMQKNGWQSILENFRKYAESGYR